MGNSFLDNCIMIKKLRGDRLEDRVKMYENPKKIIIKTRIVYFLLSFFTLSVGIFLFIINLRYGGDLKAFVIWFVLMIVSFAGFIEGLCIQQFIIYENGIMPPIILRRYLFHRDKAFIPFGKIEKTTLKEGDYKNERIIEIETADRKYKYSDEFFDDIEFVYNKMVEARKRYIENEETKK